MTEFPDDELDKLFRKSSEELDSTFDPDDWNALKRKLDENDGKTPGMWWRKWWPACLLGCLLVGGIVAYLMNVHQKSGNIDIEKTVSAKNKEEGRSKSKIQTELDSLSGQRSEPELVITNESKKILPRRGSKTGGVYLEPRSAGRGADGAFYTKGDIIKNSRVLNKRYKQPAEGITSDDARAISAISTPKELRTEGTDINNPKQIEVERTDFIPFNERGLYSNRDENRLFIAVNSLNPTAIVFNSPGELPMITMDKPEVKSDSVQSERERTPKFAIRFGYSPDLSMVGLRNISKPGTAVSLLIEYAVLPKLYFQTGVIRSTKNYYAETGSYRLPPSSQTILPSSIDGICKIIEIPLNIRYDIAQKTRFRWFAGAGLSSYNMKNEKYVYHYEKPDPGIKWYGWNGSTGWYWLSHLNASVGYEYRFSRKLSLLAEPYVKIPIKKVGLGKVDLFTAGIWFSIRYTPHFK